MWLAREHAVCGRKNCTWLACGQAHLKAVIALQSGNKCSWRLPHRSSYQLCMVQLSASETLHRLGEGNDCNWLVMLAGKGQVPLPYKTGVLLYPMTALGTTGNEAILTCHLFHPKHPSEGTFAIILKPPFLQELPNRAQGKLQMQDCYALHDGLHR